MFMFLIYLILGLMVLLSVAFFTLLERKILAGVQIRKGPDKILGKGFFQPISDGVKLFLKSSFFLKMSVKYMYMFFPFFMLFMMLMYWLVYNYISFLDFSNSLIYFLVISSLSVYGIFGSGWVSNSKYGMLGSYRSISQVVSYEVGMIFMIMILVSFSNSYSLEVLNSLEEFSNSKILGFFCCWFIWLVIILAELNRSPFDFAESESELVSGFNVEFGEIKFAFMFLAENGNIIFMSYITVLLFNSMNVIYMLMYLIFIILVRGCYPRFRYDNLMYLNWKIFLPFLMYFYFLIFSVFYLIKI